jgi:hypothetical protein
MINIVGSTRGEEKLLTFAALANILHPLSNGLNSHEPLLSTLAYSLTQLGQIAGVMLTSKAFSRVTDS